MLYDVDRYLDRGWKKSESAAAGLTFFWLWLVLILGRNAQGNPDEIAWKIKQIIWQVSTDILAKQINWCVAILIVNQRRDLSVRGILKSQIAWLTEGKQAQPLPLWAPQPFGNRNADGL